MRPGMNARVHLPVPKFGEDAGGLVFKVIQGTTKSFKSIPLGLAIPMNVGMKLVPAAMERASIVAQTRALGPGQKIIEEAGGIEAYDQRTRRNSSRFSLTIDPKDALVFAN